jgi:radial spoke head protein 9
MAESEVFGGRALNTQQRVAVTNALRKLRVDEKLDDVRFWGVVHGVQKDYIIALSTVVSDRIQKTFYFSTDDGLRFSKLPGADEWATSQSQTIHRNFSGNTSYIYKTDAEDGRQLNELERLSAAVTRIENDTCVVPVGAHYLAPTGSIRTNDAFAGLGEAASSLSSFSLFRDAKLDRTLARVRKGGEANNVDFLDTLVDDTPEGVWCLVENDNGQEVRLRNLLWPGFEARVDTMGGGFGRAYHGDGQRNDNLMFML